MDIYGQIGQNILIIDKYFKIYLKNALKEYDLNSAEGLALLMLFEQNCKTQDQIVSKLHYDKGAMTRTMKSLEEKGFVTRASNLQDNRSHIFQLTKKGNGIKEPLIKVLQTWGGELFNGVDNIELLNKAMQQIAENSSKAIKEKK